MRSRERRGQRLDVAARAAGDRAPPRAGRRAGASPWLSKNSAMKLAGKRPQLVGVGRPDRRDLGHDQALDEVLRVAALLEETPAARALCRSSRRARAPRGRSAPGRAACGGSGGRAGGRGLREHAARTARPLEAAAPVGDREAHARGLGGDAELGQQALEVGVVAVVEDDEAGVDLPACRRRLSTRPCSCARPRSRAASKTCTSWPARWSSRAATSPETPAPTTAIRRPLMPAPPRARSRAPGRRCGGRSAASARSARRSAPFSRRSAS